MGLFRKAAAKAEAPAPAAPAKRTALIVDDDLTIAELNQSVFVGRAWDVRTAYDGLGALTAINQKRPDLVLLDLMLPDLPGEKVLDSLRSARVPTKVIVVTGRYVTKKDFEPWAGLVVFVLRKPYPLVDLRGLIDWFETGALLTPKLSQVGDV
jgi:two-component system OmpR family response regulator